MAAWDLLGKYIGLKGVNLESCHSIFLLYMSFVK